MNVDVGVKSINGVVADSDGGISLNAGTGMSISGTTIGLDSPYTATTYGATTDSTLGYGSTFSVPYITRDATGRVTSGGTRTLTMPSAVTSVTTATKATAIPNVVMAFAGTTSGGTISTSDGVTKVKLPSGGTWRYVQTNLYPGNTNSKVGTLSGGDSITTYNGSYYYLVIAIRIS